MSNFYVGTQKPSKIYVETQEVKSLYLGTEKVWSSVPPWEYPQQIGDKLIITQVYSAVKTNDVLEVQ